MKNLKLVVLALVAAVTFVTSVTSVHATTVDTWPKTNLIVNGNLTVKGSITPPPTFYSTQTVTAAGLSATYGVAAATAAFSGAITTAGITNTGTANICPAKTIAQLAAITPAVGDCYSCSNCTLTYDIVVGTGAVIEGFRESGTNHGPQ